MLHYRLRWYALSTARLLLRRWQALVLGTALLTPLNDMGDVAHKLAALVLTVFDAGHGWCWRLGYLFGVQALALMWTAMQRAQIGGGGFAEMLASLPFTARHRRRVDLAVLLLASSPLLVPVVSAVSLLAIRGGGQALAQLLFVVAVALLALQVERMALARRWQSFLFVAPANLVLALSLSASSVLLRVGTGAAGVLLALVLLRTELARSNARWPAPVQRLYARLHGGVLARVDRLPPPLLISVSALYRQHRSEVLSKLLWSGAIVALARLLMSAWDYDARAFGLLVIAQCGIALLVSGLYRALHMAHIEATAYFAALPLKARWWRWLDTGSLVGLGLPLILAPAALVFVEHGARPHQLLASSASAAALIAVLRLPQLLVERHAVVFCTIVAGAWTVATAMLLN